MITLLAPFMILSKNPYFLIIFLLMITLYIILKLNTIMFTSWFALLILIILIGGLLILFLYMISLIPKENMNYNLSWPSMLVILSILMIPIFYPQISNTLNMSPQMMMYFPYMMMFSIMYLLLTLFTSTNLSNMKAGPLRLN